MFDKKSLVLEHHNLDEIRPILSKFSTDFITQLQRRSAFKRNPELYVPRFINGSQSYFEYVLHEKEMYYKAIGRFRHDSEFPITDVSQAISVLPNVLRDKNCEVNCDLSGLVPCYVSIVPKICPPGENEGREGQIADIDAETIISLGRRVNAGRYVAEYKYKNSKELRNLLREDCPEREDRVRQLVVVPDQECRVLKGVEDFVASSKDITLDDKIVGELFRDVIDLTVNLEVEYLLKKYAKGA